MVFETAAIKTEGVKDAEIVQTIYVTFQPTCKAPNFINPRIGESTDNSTIDEMKGNFTPGTIRYVYKVDGTNDIILFHPIETDEKGLPLKPATEDGEAVPIKKEKEK